METMKNYLFKPFLLIIFVLIVSLNSSCSTFMPRKYKIINCAQSHASFKVFEDGEELYRCDKEVLPLGVMYE
jgi:hypothetical protein